MKEEKTKLKARMQEYERLEQAIREELELKPYVFEQLQKKIGNPNAIIDGDIQVLYNLANNYKKTAAIMMEEGNLNEAQKIIWKANDEASIVSRYAGRIAHPKFRMECESVSQAVYVLQMVLNQKNSETQQEICTTISQMPKTTHPYYQRTIASSAIIPESR